MPPSMRATWFRTSTTTSPAVRPTWVRYRTGSLCRINGPRDLVPGDTAPHNRSVLQPAFGALKDRRTVQTPPITHGRPNSWSRRHALAVAQGSRYRCRGRLSNAGGFAPANLRRCDTSAR